MSVAEIIRSRRQQRLAEEAAADAAAKAAAIPVTSMPALPEAAGEAEADQNLTATFATYARARREGFRVIVTCGKADLLAGRTVPRPFSPLLLTSLPFCYAEIMEMTA